MARNSCRNYAETTTFLWGNETHLCRAGETVGWPRYADDLGRIRIQGELQDLGKKNIRLG